MITAFVLVAVVIGVLGISLYLSRGNWPYHANGSRGYITDMLTYAFLPALPAFVCVVGFRALVALWPEYENETANYAMMAVALIGLVVVRRLPFVAAAQNRVREARNARYNAAGG